MRPVPPPSARLASSNGRIRTLPSPSSHRQSVVALNNVKHAVTPIAKIRPSSSSRNGAASSDGVPGVGPRTAEIVQLCQSLPLYDAFTHSAGAVPVWEFRPELARHCLEYVGLETPLTMVKDAAKFAAFAHDCLPESSALRWISEQEYVLGTVLGTLRQTLHQLTPRLHAARDPHADHPICVCAAYVLTAFPHWGDLSVFAEVWHSQVSIVFSTANPECQRNFFLADGLRFRSTMEGGNLVRVEPIVVQGTTIYHLTIYGDAGTDKRLWFRFSVSGFPLNQALCFRALNLTPNAKLYRNGMRPVWRCPGVQDDWKHVGEVSFVVPNDAAYGQLSFYVVPPPNIDPAAEVHIAFTVPYGYCDLLRHITAWHHLVRSSPSNIRFEERVLCRTPDQRKLHLLIITSQSELSLPNARVQSLACSAKRLHSPHCSFEKGKKVVLVSSRVHPGEVTASHAVHGLIEFLLSSDHRAELLRKYFIFFIVPMLNPDAVARGHTRLDQYGNNLNRCYAHPSPVEQPTVYALKNVFESLQSTFGERFSFYLDFHSHASQRKAFVFGNFLPLPAQTWNLAFAKLVELHSSSLLEFSSCKFSKADMLMKDGTSRVLFGAGVLHSYTIEVSHFTHSGKIRRAVPAVTAAVPEDVAGFRGEILEESAFLGQCCASALLDLCQIHVSDVLSASGGLDYVLRVARSAAIAAATATQPRRSR